MDPILVGPCRVSSDWTSPGRPYLEPATAGTSDTGASGGLKCKPPLEPHRKNHGMYARSESREGCMPGMAWMREVNRVRDVCSKMLINYKQCARVG